MKDISMDRAARKITRRCFAKLLPASVIVLGGGLTKVAGAAGSGNIYIQRLEDAIRRYTAIVAGGGWPAIGPGPLLKTGSSGPRVAALRERLSISGDFSGPQTRAAVYDEALKLAVQKFQARNGQEPDGAVGPATLNTLKISAADRLKLLQLNLRRWQADPADLGQRHVLVNMAGFELQAVEDGHVVLDLRTIVGRQYNETPIFSDRITLVEINPYWNAPATIAAKELLPTFISNTADAESKGYEIVRNGKAEPLSSIDWQSYQGQTQLPFGVRQRPGQFNVLGQYKFLFPNNYNVYLHDTSSRSLFNKTVRTFSHGCVRVQNPQLLAGFLLKDNIEWPPDRIFATAELGLHMTIKLRNPVPVHLMYMTAWMDRAGKVQFRPDIYGRDKDWL